MYFQDFVVFNPWRRRPIDLKRAGLGGVLGGRARSPCGELRDPFNRTFVISVETHLSYQIYKGPFTNDVR